MTILVNGEAHQIEGELTIAQLVERLGFAALSVAVARNNRFVARKSWDETRVKDDEQIEILSPMQGG